MTIVETSLTRVMIHLPLKGHSVVNGYRSIFNQSSPVPQALVPYPCLLSVIKYGCYKLKSLVLVKGEGIKVIRHQRLA